MTPMNSGSLPVEHVGEVLEDRGLRRRRTPAWWCRARPRARRRPQPVDQVGGLLRCGEVVGDHLDDADLGAGLHRQRRDAVRHQHQSPRPGTGAREEPDQCLAEVGLGEDRHQQHQRDQGVAAADVLGCRRPGRDDPVQEPEPGVHDRVEHEGVGVAVHGHRHLAPQSARRGGPRFPPRVRDGTDALRSAAPIDDGGGGAGMIGRARGGARAGAFRPAGDPVADPANVLKGDGYRITVLDDGLVRLEYERRPASSRTARARPSSTARSRPPSSTSRDRRPARRSTPRGCSWSTTSGPFSTEGLSVQAKGGYRSDESVWRYGLPDGEPRRHRAHPRRRRRRGPAGARILSPRRRRRATTTRAPSCSTDDGWIAPAPPGHPRPLRLRLRPRLPRRAARASTASPARSRCCRASPWATGGAATTPTPPTSTSRLMDRFAAEGIPLSVAVLDMDWHLVDIDPRHGSGWTGYTWNRELFPDPPAFLAALHERGLATTLNVHPAEGVHAHEEHYAAIARAHGRRPRRASCRSTSTPPTRRSWRPTSRSCTTRGRPRASTSGGWTGSRAGSPGSPGSTRCGCSTTSTSWTPAGTGSAR